MGYTLGKRLIFMRLDIHVSLSGQQDAKEVNDGDRASVLMRGINWTFNDKPFFVFLLEEVPSLATDKTFSYTWMFMLSSFKRANVPLAGALWAASMTAPLRVANARISLASATS